MPLFSQQLQASGVPHGFFRAGESLTPELGGVTLPKQVHGDRVAAVEQVAGEPADGLFTLKAGTIGIQTADCVPLLLAHRSGMVAAIHSGWRGAAANICEKFLRAQSAAGLAITEWTVAMGPAAGGCCYQVGPEVTAALGFAPEKRNIDLRQIIAARLTALGLTQVEIIGPCTICSQDNWASYRRDAKAAGRNIAAIAVLP